MREDGMLWLNEFGAHIKEQLRYFRDTFFQLGSITSISNQRKERLWNYINLRDSDHYKSAQVK